MIHYKTIRAPSELAPYIDAFHLVTGEHKTVKDVPPRLGCSMIIDLEKNAKIEGYSYKAAVLGLRHSPYNLSTTDINDRIVVSFSPYGLSYFCKFPIHSINNIIVTAEEIFGNSINVLHAKLASEDTAAERIQLLERFFFNHLMPVDLYDAWLLNAADKLQCGLNIRDVCKTTTVSLRHLQRKFKARTGLSMNSFRKMARYTNAISRLKENTFLKLSDVAYDSGYYDQSHFISHIRSFTKNNPSRLSFC